MCEKNKFDIGPAYASKLNAGMVTVEPSIRNAVKEFRARTKEIQESSIKIKPLKKERWTYDAFLAIFKNEPNYTSPAYTEVDYTVNGKNYTLIMFCTGVALDKNNQQSFDTLEIMVKEEGVTKIPFEVNGTMQSKLEICPSQVSEIFEALDEISSRNL